MLDDLGKKIAILTSKRQLLGHRLLTVLQTAMTAQIRAHDFELESTELQ